MTFTLTRAVQGLRSFLRISPNGTAAPLALPRYKTPDEQELITDLVAVEAAREIHRAVLASNLGHRFLMHGAGPASFDGNLASGDLPGFGHYRNAPLREVTGQFTFTDLVAAMYQDSRFGFIHSFVRSTVLQMMPLILGHLAEARFEPELTLVLASRAREQTLYAHGPDTMSAESAYRGIRVVAGTQRRADIPAIYCSIQFLFGVAPLERADQ